MTVFKTYKPSSEKELHGIIEKNIESLEVGLEVLQYEFSIGNGIADFLCKDSGGRLVIIEVKLNEDSNILFQALRYYADIDLKKYVIARIFPNSGIDPKPSPRVILVAERFTDDLRHLTTLVIPEVDLYEYTTLTDSSGAVGVVYHRASLPKLNNEITEPSKIDDHKNYITDTNLHPLFESARQRIKETVPHAEEYVTRNYIGYKYKGRQIGWITANRKSFDVGVVNIGEKRETLEYDQERISSGNDDYSGILEDIKTSYLNLEM